MLTLFQPLSAFSSTRRVSRDPAGAKIRDMRKNRKVSNIPDLEESS